MATAVLLLLLLISLLRHGTVVDASNSRDARDFFARCPPSRCSQDGPEIRFPLRLEYPGSNSSCGVTCAMLVCSGRDTVLLHPGLGPCNVTAIDYADGTLRATLLSPTCPTLKKLMSTSIRAAEASSDRCGLYTLDTAKLVACSSAWPFTPGSDDFVAGPIPCLSDADESTTQQQFLYLVNYDASINVLPLDCKAVSRGAIPIFNMGFGAQRSFRQTVEGALGFSEMVAYWNPIHMGPMWETTTLSQECTVCEHDGQLCALNSQTNQTFCAHATSSAAALVVLLLMVATILYLLLKKRYNEEIHLKVEMFLKTYGTSKPTRYSFSEVKKIARRFRESLGYGGFGTVYKGELPNGVPVAVKMLENTKGEGEEFINEIATIGLIHHANIVRLLGFCSEGTRRAVIYEYMPNGSLEKHIFSHASNISRQLLGPDKMLDIALGIARGMEYLHQGCNQRILHFDIKPHNILLDYNFNPKISDFGLAKLCARDQSNITLTAARGTMGYIAPEIYSRNFGSVSYKSDVYSFGMLVLEMVSGRRNSDPSNESQNQVYLPEWIYEKIIIGEELVVTLELTPEAKEKLIQLAIVALWCIQWNPRNRPSMTKVVNMLTGRLQNLHMPPKPFISSENRPIP